MYDDEVSQLIALFEGAGRWCQEAEARNAEGTPVKFNDPEAVAWDLTGALCMLFGWRRASVLFRQLDRQLLGDRALRWRMQDEHIESMIALQEWNDRPSTTIDDLLDQLRAMPFHPREAGAAHS